MQQSSVRDSQPAYLLKDRPVTEKYIHLESGEPSPYGKDSLNIGRALRVGRRPCVAARGTNGMCPVLWMPVRQGLPCTSVKQGVPSGT